MLQSLHVSNYALIRSMDMELSDGLTVMTGETGAGKSILLGALGLLLGNRAETNILLRDDKKCTVEGTFLLVEEPFRALFEELELEFEPETIIRREISPRGKSRAFINDTPVRLEALKHLGSRLVDLHSQHQTLQINDPDFQLGLVDSLAGNHPQKAAVAETLRAFQKARRERQQREKQQAEFAQQREFYQFQYDEIQDLDPQPDEEKSLDEELNFLTNAEQIRTTLEQADYYLDGAEDSISGRLSELIKNLDPVKDFQPELGRFYERMESLRIEAQDLGQEISSYKENVEVDENRLTEVNERLAKLNNLLKKHQLADANALIALRDTLAEKLSADQESGEAIARLRQEEQQLLDRLSNEVETLRNTRLAVFSKLEERLSQQLRGLGMPHATVKMGHEALPAEQASESGADRVQLMFAANKGIAPEAVQKVASGGELSRIMLSIKVLLADAHIMPTMIFDEIDTGISGEVAHKVGELISELARTHQVLIITHMPQVAARGRHHLFIYKDSSGEVAETRLRTLEGEERVSKIASMIAGDRPSTLAVESARELLSAE